MRVNITKGAVEGTYDINIFIPYSGRKGKTLLFSNCDDDKPVRVKRINIKLDKHIKPNDLQVCLELIFNEFDMFCYLNKHYGTKSIKDIVKRKLEDKYLEVYPEDLKVIVDYISDKFLSIYSIDVETNKDLVDICVVTDLSRMSEVLEGEGCVVPIKCLKNIKSLKVTHGDIQHYSVSLYNSSEYYYKFVFNTLVAISGVFVDRNNYHELMFKDITDTLPLNSYDLFNKFFDVVDRYIKYPYFDNVIGYDAACITDPVKDGTDRAWNDVFLESFTECYNNFVVFTLHDSKLEGESIDIITNCINSVSKCVKDVTMNTIENSCNCGTVLYVSNYRDANLFYGVDMNTTVVYTIDSVNEFEYTCDRLLNTNALLGTVFVLGNTLDRIDCYNYLNSFRGVCDLSVSHMRGEFLKGNVRIFSLSIHPSILLESILGFRKSILSNVSWDRKYGFRTSTFGINGDESYFYASGFTKGLYDSIIWDIECNLSRRGRYGVFRLVKCKEDFYSELMYCVCTSVTKYISSVLDSFILGMYVRLEDEMGLYNHVMLQYIDYIYTTLYTAIKFSMDTREFSHQELLNLKSDRYKPSELVRSLNLEVIESSILDVLTEMTYKLQKPSVDDSNPIEKLRNKAESK